MRSCFILAMLLIVACTSGPTGSDASEILRPDPDRLRGPLPGSQPFLNPTIWYPFVPRVVAREPARNWREAGRPNPKLSDACRRGEFRERATMRFRAIYGDGLLGVAFGYGLNLVDTKGQADPSMIYYFRNANSTACLILERRNPDPNVQELVRQQRQQAR